MEYGEDGKRGRKHLPISVIVSRFSGWRLYSVNRARRTSLAAAALRSCCQLTTNNSAYAHAENLFSWRHVDVCPVSKQMLDQESSHLDASETRLRRPCHAHLALIASTS